VPVYISYEAHEDKGNAPEQDKKEWRRIYSEANAKLKRSGTVHVYVLAPADGEVIESIDIGTATQPEKLLSRLNAVVEKLKTPEGEPVVKPGPQSRPPKSDADSLVLHLAARSYKGTWNEFPVENWIVLSRKEAATLLPAGDVTVGQSWELDKDVSARFLTKFLPNGYGYASYHKTSIREQALKATVVSVEKDVVRARIDGTLKLKHQSLNFNASPPAAVEDVAQMPLVGFVDFEPGKQRVRTIGLLADKASAREGQVEYAVALRSADAPEPKTEPKEALLFDFENPADLKAWSNLELPDVKQQEPPARIELSAENATRGKHSLKITFAGGRWPTITTTQVPEEPPSWMPYWTFQADVTAGRDCLVGFTVLQEKSQRGGGWDPVVSRWTKTEFLKPGKNTVTGIIHDSNNYSINAKMGKVVRFEIFMYNPHEGEAIYVDNIRLSTAKEGPPKTITRFPVLGTDLVVSGETSGVKELGQKLKGQWTKPEKKTLEQVEGEFRSLYEELKGKHPRAVLAVFRDGEKGYDPANPDKVYTGWKDAYWSSHGPDGMTVERSTNLGHDSGHEIFMRHRSPLMRVDLACIPERSEVLAARLIIIRDFDKPVKEHNPDQPNMWVVEPCNRPWEEYEVNAYEYARDKFWKAIGGMSYEGDDPDFLPRYLAHGPSQGKVNTWDFTHAIRFWTDGKHANHGFMLHGDAGDWLPRAHSREAKEIADRPAVWVIYEPGK
jgi:hypothetical protein